MGTGLDLSNVVIAAAVVAIAIIWYKNYSQRLRQLNYEIR